MGLEVSGLPTHVGDHLIPKALLALGYAARVHLVGERLEVHGRGDMALGDLGSHLLDLRLARGEARDWHSRRVQPDSRVRAMKLCGALPNDGRKHEVRRKMLDLL